MNPVPLRAPGFDGAERRIGNAARRAIVAGAAARQVSSTFQTGALQSGTTAGDSPIFQAYRSHDRHKESGQRDQGSENAAQRATC